MALAEAEEFVRSKASVTNSVSGGCNYKKKSQKSTVIEKVRCKTPHFLLLAKSDFLAVAEAEGFEPSSRLLGYLISSQARYDH
ncbi:MAG: hypothetical protein K2H24_06700, partial [Clostridia bacterium]|nr:hypothetical protein [Clostridia bacterium]